MLTYGPHKPPGEDAQVVVAGNLNYLQRCVAGILGVQSVPSTRSTNRTFPYWLRNDNRPIADEYFRGSYTQGIWAQGKIMQGLEYRVMLANNLSALGVSAAQLDAKINTFSGALTWMPTTGEFGPGNGTATLKTTSEGQRPCSAHYTRSTETPQSQPNTDSIEKHPDPPVRWNAAVRRRRLRHARADNTGPLTDDGARRGREISRLLAGV